MKDTLLILFVLLSLSVRSQQVAINDSVSTFTNDSCNTGMISQIKPEELSFEKKNNRRINPGLTGSEYHFIVLKVSAQKKLTGQYLSIDNTSLDQVRIYKIKPGYPPTLLYEGGRFIPYQKKQELRLAHCAY